VGVNSYLPSSALTQSGYALGYVLNYVLNYVLRLLIFLYLDFIELVVDLSERGTAQTLKKINTLDRMP